MKKYFIYCCNGDGGDCSPSPTKPLDSDVKNADRNKNDTKGFVK